MVEEWTHKPNLEGSNPTTGTRSSKMVEKLTNNYNFKGSSPLEKEDGKKVSQLCCVLVSISPTFYEQLLHQICFAKKLQTQIVST